MLKINPEILTTIVLIAALFMLLSIVVGLLIFRYKHHQQRHIIEIQRIRLEFEQQLIQSQIEVQEDTFNAVGKELHDNVGQLLSTAKMLLGITERNLNPAPDTLVTAHETLATAIRELRTLSKSLTREWLEQFDLMENLGKEMDRIRSAGELQIRFVTEGRLNLPADRQIILFRVIQESLQNVIKHAHAGMLYIAVSQQTDILQITVRDDGIGFIQQESYKGIGLMNMKHRMRILQGEISWLQAPDHGTEVLIQLPIQNHQE